MLTLANARIHAGRHANPQRVTATARVRGLFPWTKSHGQLAKAEQEINTAVTTSANPDPRDYYRLGEAYALNGKWDDAIQAFRPVGLGKAR
ncbi:MAG: tetratricopeptide repeat protein [Terriglobia bacterium]